MDKMKRRNQDGKLIVETDFLDGQTWLLELVRAADGRFALVRYEVGTSNYQLGAYATVGDQIFCPPEKDEINRYIQLPSEVGKEESAGNLLQALDAFLSNCLDLDERYRFLLACFALSTWLIDRLPVTPIVALVGLPGSGRSTALQALSLICRRSFVTSDISSAAFYRVCDQLTATVCIDDNSAGKQREAFLHLLRSSTSQQSVIFRGAHSYRCYGAKVVVWAEMPNEEALTTRCLLIPMQETLRRELRRTTDATVRREAEALQGKLLRFRLDRYHRLKLPHISGVDQLRLPDRDLFEALALPIGEDPQNCARLLEYFISQRQRDREPLPGDKTAVLEGLFRQVHARPDQEGYALRPLKTEVNTALANAGERFRMNERGISRVLGTFGLNRRKRTGDGYVVLVDRAERKCLHELLRNYGVESLSAFLPEEDYKACEFCRSESLADQRPTPVDSTVVVGHGSNGNSTSKESNGTNGRA
jgi:hypothetical protein